MPAFFAKGVLGIYSHGSLFVYWAFMA